jgi:23S rRNA (cytosine1962-C5)-methyltransferase
MQEKKQARLRLRITAAAEAALRGGHPWLFADSIREQNREGKTGEIAAVYDRKDQFLAAGLFDAESPIRFRTLQAGKTKVIDETWWRTHLQAALERRKGWFDEHTTGFRWINGESDGWPGFVLDRYERTLVVKIYTAAWMPWLETIAPLITEKLRPERIVLRLSRNIMAGIEKQYGQKDGEIIEGQPLDASVIFRESGLRFEADVVRGQKTGFFLDQRENRRRILELARGRTVLNAFSFTGGFSLYAARGGAKSVTDLDISRHALESAQRNFALNHDTVAHCEYHQAQGDAFEWLSQSSQRFGLVILDPPSLAKRESERAGALRAYAKLARLGLDRLEPGGVVLACSCSAHVSSEEFFEAVRGTAVKSGRRFEELGTTGHPPDHPATFKAAEYLKGIYLLKKSEADLRQPR